jgi:hypothetical protein
MDHGGYMAEMVERASNINLDSEVGLFEEAEPFQ